MPQQVGTINIEAHEDTDLVYLFPTTRSDDGTLVDSLWTGRMQVRDSFDSLKAEAAVTVSDTGRPRVYIRREDLVLPGQYSYDLILKSPLGLHLKRYSGQIRVQSTVTEWVDPAPAWIPPPISSPAVIAAHNSSDSAHADIRAIIQNSGGQRYEALFTQSAVTVGNVLPLLHPLGATPTSLILYDDQRVVTAPDSWRSIGTTAIEVNLTSFVPISGIWLALLSN